VAGVAGAARAHHRSPHVRDDLRQEVAAVLQRSDLVGQRGRLAATLSDELAALTDKIAALERSRDLLAQIVADVRGSVVGPGSPGDPGHAEDYRAVRKAGPAVGVVG